MTILPEHHLYKDAATVSNGAGDRARTLFVVFLVMLVLTWISV